MFAIPPRKIARWPRPAPDRNGAHSLSHETLMELRDQLQSTLGTAYTLERELGGGGMSRVFVAQETAHGRQVVVKVLPSEMTGAVSIDRFKREINLAAQLQHPHIVPLLTSGDAGGLPYFTMPFIKGESLRARIAQHGELPVSEAVRILREVASALAFAHDAGVVHRDIKPDNVLLSAGSAMVTDFGVAKALSASTSPGASGLTSVGVALGTPAYMSPEQATADPLIDHRADVYAFGAMAYEMLSGQPPFSGRPPQAMLAACVNEAPESLAKRRPSVPPSLAALIMRCLEKRAADRPQSAAEIVQSLDAIATSSGGMQPALGAPESRAGGVFWTRRTSVAIAAVTAFVVAATVAVWRAAPLPTSSAPKSIAVLPFASLGGAKENDAFGEGITEEITDALGKLPGLTVPAPSTVKAAMAKGFDARRVGAELGVASLLQGSIQRAGDQVRISARLVDAATGVESWSGQYNHQLKDVFAVEDSIARAIVSALRLTLVGGTATPIVRVATTNPEAHALYLQGLYLWNRRTARNLQEAIALFQQATEKDPRYAKAWAGIALAYTLLPHFTDGSTAEFAAKANAAASRALALDSTVAEAYAAIGYTETRLWHNAAAERAFGRAFAIDSTFATAHQWYALHLAHLGRLDEALKEMQRAHALDPQSPIINMQMGTLLYYTLDYGQAEATLRALLETDPGFQLAYRDLGNVFMAQHRYDEAATAFARHLELAGNRPSFGVSRLAWADVLGGHTADARALLKELLERSKSRLGSPWGIALIYDAQGDRENAQRWLAKAVTEFDPYLHYGSRGPELDHLRADPRGAALLAKTETPNDTPERRE